MVTQFFYLYKNLMDGDPESLVHSIVECFLKNDCEFLDAEIHNCVPRKNIDYRKSWDTKNATLYEDLEIAKKAWIQYLNYCLDDLVSNNYADFSSSSFHFKIPYKIDQKSRENRKSKWNRSHIDLSKEHISILVNLDELYKYRFQITFHTEIFDVLFRSPFQTYNRTVFWNLFMDLILTIQPHFATCKSEWGGFGEEDYKRINNLEKKIYGEYVYISNILLPKVDIKEIGRSGYSMQSWKGHGILFYPRPSHRYRNNKNKKLNRKNKKKNKSKGKLRKNESMRYSSPYEEEPYFINFKEMIRSYRFNRD